MKKCLAITLFALGCMGQQLVVEALVEPEREKDCAKTFKPSDILGTTYSLDLGEEDSAEKVTVYFFTNADGRLDKLGLQTRRGEPSVVLRDNDPESEPDKSCKELAAEAVARTGYAGNTQLVGCLAAICESVGCLLEPDCDMQSELNGITRIMCMVKPVAPRIHIGGGIYCSGDCDEY